MVSVEDMKVFVKLERFRKDLPTFKDLSLKFNMSYDELEEFFDGTKGFVISYGAKVGKGFAVHFPREDWLVEFLGEL